MPETYSIEPPSLLKSRYSFEFFLKILTYYIVFIIGAIIFYGIFYIVYQRLFSSKSSLNFGLLIIAGSIIFSIGLVIKYLYFYKLWPLISISFENINNEIAFGIMNPYTGKMITKIVQFQDLSIQYSEHYDLAKGISKKMIIKKTFLPVNHWKISYSDWVNLEDLDEVVERLKLLAFENNRYFVENETWLTKETGN